jgi:hypothetical protein
VRRRIASGVRIDKRGGNFLNMSNLWYTNELESLVLKISNGEFLTLYITIFSFSELQSFVDLHALYLTPKPCLWMKKHQKVCFCYNDSLGC